MQSESSTGPPEGAIHDSGAEASTQPGTRDSALAALAGQATAAAGPGRVLTRSKLCTLQRSILCRPDRHGPGRLQGPNQCEPPLQH